MTQTSAPLGRIARMVGGGTPSKRREDFWGGSIPWVSPKDMKVRDIGDAEDHISESAVRGSATQVVPEGSVLVVVRSGILAHHLPVSICRVPVALNQDLKAFLPGGPLLPEYLAYALDAKAGHILRACVKRGATVHSIDIGRLQKVDLPVPPPSEQRRIIEILDQARSLQWLREEADAKANRILPSLLARALGSPSNWPNDPRSRALGELVNPVSGATPSKKNKEYWSGKLPWVSPKDMKQDFLSDAQDHVSQSALHDTNLKIVEPGNVLIVVRGMILARDVPLALNVCPVTINQDMKALVPRTPEVSGPFIWAALRLAKASLQSLVRTAGHGTRKLDTPELMQFPVVVPSSKQLAQVDSAVGRHRLFGERRESAKAKLDQLFAVLLSRAFDGSLTAVWRQAHMAELLQEMKHHEKSLTTLDRQE